MFSVDNALHIDAPPALIFELAADIRAWPELLPHYRYVVILEEQIAEGVCRFRRAEMSATRSGIPVRWISTQSLDREGFRIRYHHVGGVTRGMDVEWRIVPESGGCEVSIIHDLPSPNGVLRLPFAREIAANFFIHHIADRTLHGIKRRAEAAASGRAP